MQRYNTTLTTLGEKLLHRSAKIATAKLIGVIADTTDDTVLSNAMEEFQQIIADEMRKCVEELVGCHPGSMQIDEEVSAD